MSEVGIGLPTTHFRIDRTIIHSDNVVLDQRPEEAWPTGPRIVLGRRTEQRLSGDDIDIDPRLLVIPVEVVKGRFRYHLPG